MARTFDPFREMDRWFGESSRTLAMPLDLVRQGDDFYAFVDLPGVDPSTIDIDAEERTLTIRAVRKPVDKGEGQQWLVRERPTGTFARQLTLGAGLALDRVEATYGDGVLTLRIPVAEAAKPRKISVTLGGDDSTIPGEVDQDKEGDTMSENTSAVSSSDLETPDAKAGKTSDEGIDPTKEQAENLDVQGDVTSEDGSQS